MKKTYRKNRFFLLALSVFMGYLCLGNCFMALGQETGNSSVTGFPYCEPFMDSTTRANTVYGDDAYLTSGIDDPDGLGALRLTEAEGNQSGYVYVDVPFSSAYGIKTSFEYFSYGGTGADGFSFFLFDSAVESFKTGGYGGSLGYAPNTNSDILGGLSGGYIGIGFDEYGNYGNTIEGKTGGFSTGSTRYPNSIVVRGPESTNYDFIQGKRTNTSGSNGLASTDLFPISSGGVGTSRVTDRNQVGYRKVFIDMVPNETGVGFLVTLSMEVTTTSGNPREVVIFKDLSYPYTPPANLKIGFAASTGGYTNYHEIRNVIVEVSDKESLEKPIAQPKSVEACLGQINEFVIDAVNDVFIPNENGFIRCLQIYENLADTVNTEEMNPCLNEQCNPANQTLTLESGVFVTDSEGGTVTFTSDSSFTGGDVEIYYTVTDNYGKTSAAQPITVTINPSPEVPVITALKPDPMYLGDTVALAVSNIAASHTYQWFFDGEEIAGATESSFAASQSGSYTVKATNEWGCGEISEAVSLSFSPAPDITVTESPIVGETCQNDGSVSFDVTNTFETDYYRLVSSEGTVVLDWTEIEGSTILLDGLGSGGYTLEIYDRYREMAYPFQHDFVIADERQIIITPIVKNVQCFDDDPVGSIRFEVKTIGCGSNNIRVSYKHQEDENFTPEATIGLGGGKSEYIQYLDGTINFPVGVYDFRVRQGGGNCTDCGILDYKVTVGGPPSALEMDEYDITIQDFSCSGNAYYQATANPTGGWGGYTYLWSDGQTTQTATYLSPGNTYTVTVTDAGGCEVVVTQTMPGTNTISMSITAELTDPGCGADNGTIAVTYSDIDPNDYTITWMKDDPDTGTIVSGTQDGIENLSPATYFLILTDKNNSDCKIIREYILIEEGTTVAVDPSDQEICEGESVVFTPSIASPTGSYTFHWYHDIEKIDPVIDNTGLGPQEVVYEIDVSGVLTVTGLPFDGAETTYSYFVDVSGDDVCETTAGELKEVKVTVNFQPAPPEVRVLGGHSRI